MKLTCFGKYGPYPKGGEATSCYMLEHNDKHILIELGCGALSKVLEKIKISDIDGICLSHLHADHMGDMLTLRYALKTAQVAGEIEGAVPVYMPAKPQAEADMLLSSPLMDIRTIEDGMSTQLFGIKISFTFMLHPYLCYAMKFEADGKTFVYSGDVKKSDTLADFAKDADLFIIEAALLEKDVNASSGHISAVEAGRIAKQSGAKRVLVTHMFPKYDQNDVLKEVWQNCREAQIIEENIIYEV